MSPVNQLSENAEEALAHLWVSSEEQHAPSCPVSELEIEEREAALGELQERDLVEQEGETVSLTEAGKIEAAAIIRRERLAERLLTDVLNIGQAQAAEEACRFEHFLRRGIDDEICTLLGHPKVCPHGSVIPPGECCRAGASSVEKVVTPLSEMRVGQTGVVAYLHGRRSEMMRRMLALGVVPGARISLLQRMPSYVFQAGQTQVAVDNETAQEIYIRITDRRVAPSPPPAPRRFLGLRFRRGRRGWQ